MLFYVLKRGYMQNKNISIFEKKLSDISKYKKDFPLSNYTTFKTGGPAQFLVQTKDVKKISQIVSLTNSFNIPLTVIGGGSNLLISDEGISGLTLRMFNDTPVDTKDLYIMGDGKIYASASVKKENFIDFAISNGFDGIQFMAGVPGTIGGGIFMNAGTFLGTFVNITKQVEIVDSNGKIKTIDISEKISSYRDMNIEKNSIITGGIFNLPKSNNSKNIQKEVDELLNDRANKHPLNYPSAGSVFKNPEGFSSWKLVNDAGLKGVSIGGAKVSEKHTNFIINNNNATSKDIYNLIQHIQKIVLKKFNVSFETEIKFLGNF